MSAFFGNRIGKRTDFHESYAMSASAANELDSPIPYSSLNFKEEPHPLEGYLQRCLNPKAERQYLFLEPSPPLSVFTADSGLRARAY